MNYPTEIEVGGKSYPVNYIAAAGLRSTVRFRKGAVLLKLSRFLRGRDRELTIAKFLKWAEERLEGVNNNEFVNPIYKDGEIIWTHNKLYKLAVNFHESDRCRSYLRDDYVLELWLPEGSGDELIRDLAEKLIIKDRTPYLRSVLDELNQLYFQEPFNSCRFKRVGSRFGSCSSKRNINIAFRLLFAPKEVFRYVCVHELAHLKEFNHSRRFWDLVATAMPNFKGNENWLRKNGFILG